MENFKTWSIALDLPTPPLRRLASGLRILYVLFFNSCPPITVLIWIFILSLTNVHRTNRFQFSFNSITLSYTFSLNSLLDKGNVLTEDLLIESKIFFSLSGCIFSLINLSKILFSNCSTIMKLPNILYSITVLWLYFAIEQFQS